VIFDRIREIKGKSPDLTPAMVNRSLNETLSRTLITSGLTFLVVLAQFFFGGPSIHAFAFCLVIGLIAGTYSTVFIACPVLLWMTKPSARPHQPPTPSRELQEV
jgi:SecD/SecF fusion protein